MTDDGLTIFDRVETVSEPPAVSGGIAGMVLLATMTAGAGSVLCAGIALAILYWPVTLGVLMFLGVGRA